MLGCPFYKELKFVKRSELSKRMAYLFALVTVILSQTTWAASDTINRPYVFCSHDFSGFKPYQVTNFCKDISSDACNYSVVIIEQGKDPFLAKLCAWENDTCQESIQISCTQEM